MDMTVKTSQGVGRGLRDLAGQPRAIFSARPPAAVVYLVSLLIVAGGGFVAWMFDTYLGVDRVGIIFLVPVIIVAMRFGARPGLFAAVAASVAYNVFLQGPEVGLSPPSADEVVSLAVFLILALTTGGMTGQVRDKGVRAADREQTTNFLFQASREMSSIADEIELRSRLRDWAERAVGGPVFLFDREGRVIARGSDAAPPPGPLLAALLASSRPDGGAPVLGADWSSRTLRLDETGDMLVWKTPVSKHAERSSAVLIDVLISISATAIARAKISKLKAQAEAAEHEERLLGALLSSVSHDFRTPLAAILASASSLLEYGEVFDEAVRRDLLTNVQEEAERLNFYVTKILNLTQLEAGSLTPSLEPSPLNEVLVASARRARSMPGRKVVVTHDEGSVVADRALLEQALVNVLDNAVRFTPSGGAVEVCGRITDGCAVIEVTDQGSGVDKANLSRIFDKFYREPEQERLTGTGLGLFIAREFIEAMQGRIVARPRPDGQPGLSVLIQLPAETAP